MNVLLLPQEMIDSIQFFQKEHQPKMKKVLEELIQHNKEDFICVNCISEANKEYKSTIFGHEYHYCSIWCMIDFEDFIRKESKYWKARENEK